MAEWYGTLSSIKKTEDKFILIFENSRKRGGVERIFPNIKCETLASKLGMPF